MMKAVRGLLAVALFPLVVTAVVSCGFLVGCPVPKSAGVALAMATVATATVAWWRGGWRGLALALGWLVLTFFIADQFVFGQLGDYFHYHYPQALLLGEGWNPVFASSMTEASAAMGVPLDTLRPVHTFCFPLALAQFCAAVAWLTGSLCGFLWEPFLFLPAVCWLAWVTLRAVPGLSSKPVIAAAVVVIALMANQATPEIWVPLDVVVFLLEFALLLCAWWVLSGNALWPRLWMAAAALMLIGTKQMGVLFVGILLLVLIGAFAMRRDWPGLRRMVTLSLWVALGSMFLWFHPYLTNWVDYGGPLFPSHTFWSEWTGWDVTIDLGTSPADNRPSLWRFVVAHPLVVGLAIVACLACRSARSRWWLIPMGVLLLSAFVCPSKIYGYIRYAPALPLVGLFACLALWESGFRLGRRTVCILFPLWALTVAIPWFMQAPKNLSYWCAALDLRTLLATPQTDLQDVWIISAQATSPAKEYDKLCKQNPHIYPQRADTYLLTSLFAENGLTIQEALDINSNEAKANYASISDVYLLVSNSSPLCKRLTPRPLSIRHLFQLPTRVWQDFRHRWLSNNTPTS